MTEDVFMKDEFLQIFGWITELLKRPIPDFFKPGSDEYAIVEQLKNEWGKRDTAELLKELTAEYGDKAGKAVEKLIELSIVRDWSETGRTQAHDGSEIEDFIKLLWIPLKELGFEYSISKENDSTKFCVIRCPVFELAEKTGMHGWLYHLACATDFYSTPSFCPKIGFSRTKTLMEGHDCCNHEYYYR